MKKVIILFLFSFLLSVLQLYAGPFEDRLIEARNLLNQGLNHWEEEKMQESLAQFQRLLHLEKEPWLVHYYIGLAEYRLGVYHMNQKEGKKEAEKYFDDAIEHLKQSQALNDTFPESHALISSCYGNKIGSSPWKGMTLGPRSGAAISKAVLLGPNNPRVWLLKGLGSNYTPKAFGGGKEKALEELNKAIKLYEEEKVQEPIYPQWGYDEAYAWLGIVLKDMGRLEEARTALEKGLSLNPENGWIKYTLLPSLDSDNQEE